MTTVKQMANLRAWLPNQNGGWAQLGPGALMTAELMQVSPQLPAGRSASRMIASILSTLLFF